MVATHTRAKDQGHRSVGSKVRVETVGRTDRQTDGADCVTLNLIYDRHHAIQLHWVSVVARHDGSTAPYVLICIMFD